MNSDSEKMLDALLEDYMTPPKDLAQRICASCQAERKLEEEFMNIPQATTYTPHRRRRGLYDITLRIAAAFVLVGCVLALAYKTSGTKHASVALSSAEIAEDSVSAMAMDEIAPAAMSMPEFIAMAPNCSEASQGFSLQDSLSMAAKNIATEQNLMTVSTDGTTPRARRRSQLSPVDNELTHVWLAKDSTIIRQFVEGTAEDIEKSFKPDENGVITLGISADDASIQSLVDELYNSGHWKLLSSASPQPNQGNNTPLDGHPVNYTLKIACE
ncbi:MAG: hypothetical protein MJ106_06080 [Lentisphaeria bacterium]|nr:hypothetical protein [Lentisphaeria bacterium]